MVMADLFLRNGGTFSVAHCNFQLRGKASDGDEAFVSSWCERNHIRFFSKKFKLDQGSTQLNARNARYRWFETLVATHGFSKVVTAHHLNDSLETTLLNLVRGSGLRGLTGINDSDNNILRPLSKSTKEEILEYARKHNIDWREDHTNQSTIYDRNLIRHQVIPLLYKLNPSLLSTYARTQDRLLLSERVVQQRVEQVGKILENDKEHLINLDWINDESDLIVLNELLKKYGFNYEMVKQIWEARMLPGKSFLSGEWELTVDRNQLILVARSVKWVDKAFLLEGEGIYHIDELKIEIIFQHAEEVSIVNDPMVALLNKDLMKFPLVIRSWEMGDKFKPLGMKGMKKISDFLIDLKVPMPEKKKVKVMLSDNEIVWVIGYRIAEGFKLKKGTRTVARVQISQ